MPAVHALMGHVPMTSNSRAANRAVREHPQNCTTAEAAAAAAARPALRQTPDSNKSAQRWVGAESAGAAEAAAGEGREAVEVLQTVRRHSVSLAIGRPGGGGWPGERHSWGWLGVQATRIQAARAACVQALVGAAAAADSAVGVRTL
eukprot:1136688-Pelagomonas_calceolata.AAC.7